MAHNLEILDIVGPWKTRRFRSAEISLHEAVSSLASSEPLIEAKSVATSGRWQVCNIDSDNSAILVHVGVWAWGSDIDTGNFVPAGEQAPKGLPESRIQNSVSFRCEVTYAFDTSADESFYDHLKALEEHVKAQPSFNKGNRPRRVWQNGIGIGSRQKIMFTSKVFAKRMPYNTPQDVPYRVKYNVHPWIRDAVEDPVNKQHIPNPDRPQCFEYTNSTLTRLEDAEFPIFQRGDIIWISLTISFIIGGDSWWPEVVPREMVRVGKLPDHIMSSTDSVVQTFDPGLAEFEAGAVMTLIESSARSGYKRKDRGIVSDSAGGGETSRKRQETDEDHVMIDAENPIASEDNGAPSKGGTWKTRSKGKESARGKP